MSLSKHPAEMTPAERLDYFLTLEPDWDSYGAPAIDPRAIAEAKRLLADWPSSDTPFPFPTTDGGISFEWSNDDAVKIEPDGSIRWEDDE